jgi:hypothetical protein
MHLSISNSDEVEKPVGAMHPAPRPVQASVAVIACLALVIAGAEFLSRYAFPRISQIEGRISRDEHEAMSIGAPIGGSPPTVLLVGNSLLLLGLDYPRIQSEMAPDARMLRFAIENTEYFDWYYGLRHLFASGARPSMVVLCLNLGQTVSARPPGDYSARHLFGWSELLPVAHDAGMNATQTSGLVLAHWSAFYASRLTIRNFILNKADPPYAIVLHSLADSAVNPLPSDNELVNRARGRLSAIQQLCSRYGVGLVLLIPPSLGRRNDLLASAAQLQNVPFDYPFPTGTLGPQFFRADHAHLNEQGAGVFTDAIEHCLRERLEQRPRN